MQCLQKKKSCRNENVIQPLNTTRICLAINNAERAYSKMNALGLLKLCVCQHVKHQGSDSISDSFGPNIIIIIKKITKT